MKDISKNSLRNKKNLQNNLILRHVESNSLKLSLNIKRLTHRYGKMIIIKTLKFTVNLAIIAKEYQIEEIARTKILI